MQLSRAGGVALALVPAMMLAAVLWHPVWDVDIFWQLKLGELILTRHGPVMAEPFAARHLGEPLPAFAWLGQAIMAQVRLWSGWTGLRLFNALCWTGGFWLAASAAVRRGATREMALMALPVALLVAMPNASIRPQSFALLAFGLLLRLLESEGRRPLKLALAALVLLLWQNAHPSVAVAVAWLGAQAGWGWLCWLVRPGHDIPWERTALTGLAGAAMFATPDGLGLFHLATYNAAISKAVGVSEWLPLWHPANRATAFAILPISALTGALLLRNRRRLDWELVVPWLVLLTLSAMATRFAMFWAIALVPVLAPVLPRLAARSTPAWLGAAAVAVIGPAVLVARPTRTDPTIPVSQIERLKATGVRGTVFAHFPWGGPAIDIGYPGWRVAMDGRYYRYSEQEWQNYYAVVAGDRGLAAVERDYRPVAYVLSPAWTPRLIAELRADPAHWRPVSDDGTAAIFVTTASGQAVLPDR